MNPIAPVKLTALDDDPQSLELIREALDGAEIEIACFTDPVSGLKAIQETNPEIVLLDLVMPGHDGMKMLESILEQNPETEVILLTGHYSTESAIEAIGKGACDYLTKPISVNDFR